MSQAIRDGLYAKLTASQGAGTLYLAVAGRIYETRPPQAAQLPFLVYRVESNETERFYGGAVSQECVIEFEIRGVLGTQGTGGGSADAQAVGAIEQKLYDLLHGVSFAVTGHDRGLAVCNERGVPEVDDDSHVSLSRYVVTATKF